MIKVTPQSTEESTVPFLKNLVLEILRLSKDIKMKIAISRRMMTIDWFMAF